MSFLWLLILWLLMVGACIALILSSVVMPKVPLYWLTLGDVMAGDACDECGAVLGSRKLCRRCGSERLSPCKFVEVRQLNTDPFAVIGSTFVCGLKLPITSSQINGIRCSAKDKEALSKAAMERGILCLK